MAVLTNVTTKPIIENYALAIDSNELATIRSSLRFYIKQCENTIGTTGKNLIASLKMLEELENS